MFIFYAVIIGLLVGCLTGGNLANLSSVNLKCKWLALSAFVMQLILFSGLPFVKSIGSFIIVCLHLLSYLGLLGFITINLAIPGVVIIGSGIFLNFLVISVNKGYMPTTLQRVSDGNTHNNVVGMGSGTLLPWLGDIFHLPAWLPMSTAFSIGDVFIAAGVCIYLVLNMRVNSKKAS